MAGRTTSNRPVARQLTVWPCFIGGGFLAVLGLVFIVIWWPSDLVGKSDLVMVGGEIEKVSIRDNISDSPAGAVMPGFTSVYFTLADTAGEFRYPHTHPQFLKVRDYTAVAIDVWVDPAELHAGGVITIWQIREHNPHDKPGEETFVSYEDIVTRLSGTAQSMVRVGFWLLTGGAALLAIGLALVQVNRRRQAP